MRSPQLDAGVHIAGIDCRFVNAEEMDAEHWRTLIDVDLSGPWWVTKAALPHLIEQRSGRVIFTRSITSLEPS